MRKVPSELGRWELLILPSPGRREHRASAIVEWSAQDQRVLWWPESRVVRRAGPGHVAGRAHGEPVGRWLSIQSSPARGRDRHPVQGLLTDAGITCVELKGDLRGKPVSTSSTCSSV